jgi:hypothetical protein
MEFGSSVYFPSLDRIAIFGKTPVRVSEALTIPGALVTSVSEYLQRAKNCGVSGYLNKTIRISQLPLSLQLILRRFVRDPNFPKTDETDCSKVPEI